MPTKMPSTKPSGKRYRSVDELLRTSGVPQDIRENIAQLEGETHLTTCLAVMRTKAGLTQAQMAKAIGVSRSRISKLESERDNDLTLGEIRAYCKATGAQMNRQ